MFFRATPYQPLVFHEAPYGKVREHGNFSFAVVYDAGHFVPADKPDLALELFRRAISGLDISTGLLPVSNSTIPFAPDTPVSTTPAALATSGKTDNSP